MRPTTSAGAFHARTSDTLVGLYDAAKAGDNAPPRETRIPGYTGHVAGMREVSGRSQSRATARALAHGPEALYWRDSLPADPQSKVSLVGVQVRRPEAAAPPPVPAPLLSLPHRQAAYAQTALGCDMGSTLIARGFSGIGHISGYTGHVMGIRECELGKSFGHITRAAGHTQLNPKDGRTCVVAPGGR